MELMRLGEPGREIPVLTEHGQYFDLRSVTTDFDGVFLGAGGIARTGAGLKAGLPELAGAAAMRVGAPVAKPGAVLCIGQNYAAHATESGDVAPSVPILFFKHPNTVVGAYDDVVVPPSTAKRGRISMPRT